MALTQACIQGERSSFECEHQFLNEGGEERWVVTRAVVVHDETGSPVGLSGMTADISERKRAEEEVREREFLLRAMLEGATDGIWVKDTEGRYRMWNQSGARFFSMEAGDLLGKNDFELFPADVAQKIMVDDREILESGQGRTAEDVHTLNGVERTFETKKGPFHGPDGQVLGLMRQSWKKAERCSTRL